MNTTLLEIAGQTACSSRREAELSALVQRLLGEVAQLRGAVAELRQQVGYWKGMFEKAKRKNEKLQKEIDELRAENRQLKDKLFAAKSEKKHPKDRSNGLDNPEDPSQQPRRPRGHQPNSPGPRRRDHSHLPVVEKAVELSPDERACPRCGKPAVEMTETEDSEEIEVEVRAHRRRIRRKRYRHTCDCPKVSQTLTAPAPPKLIPKGRYGISVWVHVLLAKFASHRALGNAIEALTLYDLDLPQGTITDGLHRLTPLLEPIYEAKGILMVDRYSAYKAMAQVKSGVVKLVFCWAHVRRDFIAVGKGWPELTDWAVVWLRRIHDLYQLNRQRLKHGAKTANFASHDAALREVVDAMHRQATEELADAKLRQPCRKALQSLLDHWPGLTRFADPRRSPWTTTPRSERFAARPWGERTITARALSGVSV